MIEAQEHDWHAEANELDRDLTALDYLVFQAVYAADPAGFVEDCIAWPDGERPLPYQLLILDELYRHGREAVRGPHGLGKTAIASWAILHFALTRDGRDWKTPATASVNRQLREYLWPDLHKWARRLRWARIGRPAFREGVELQTMHLRLRTGSAFAAASNQPSQIEGAHADHLLVLFDEAKAIQDGTWDAIEGAFAGAGPDTGREAYALAFSTPGEPSGRFYAIHSARSAYTHWNPRHVTLQDAIAAGRVSSEWAETMARQWGRNSALYRRRVLGEFATDTDSVIPLDWIEAAVDRWRDHVDEAGLEQHEVMAGRAPIGRLTALGIDVADGGADRNQFARRVGKILEGVADPLASLRLIGEDEKHQEMAIADAAAAVLRERGGSAIVDVVGVGAGVYSRLRQLRLRPVRFQAAEKDPRRDRSGQLQFANRRAGAWWRMRDLLNPQYDERVMLPPDDELIADLATPKWREGPGGRVLIESKDDIRERLGRSTDKGDAAVMAFDSSSGPVRYESVADIRMPARRA